MTHAPLLYEKAGAELVIGIVSAVGTDSSPFRAALKDRLARFEYATEAVRLSTLLPDLPHGVELVESPEGERIDSYMRAGSRMRELSGRGDMLALATVGEIARGRDQVRNNDNYPRRPRTAYLLETLKHPDEVRTLRHVYGGGFYLVGLHAPRSARKHYLVESKGIPEEQADALIDKDADEGGIGLGQQTRDTFELADAFIRSSGSGVTDEIHRFVDLIFGDPFRFPSRDEHGMFLAYSGSLRSAALGRQVGAAVLSDSGDVLAIGYNEVPAFSGGVYDEKSKDDQREYRRGRDSNAEVRDRIVRELVVKLGDLLPKKSIEDLVAEASDRLRGSGIYSITEYGREVHAEVNSLLSCARSGVSPVGATLYSTTFPCHNCAKHIIAAGVKRVVYIEPYPKSMAMELHDDAIADGAVDSTPVPDKVTFGPFVGVGPRRYVDLFSTALGSGHPIERKLKDGRVAEFTREGKSPRVCLLPVAYPELERIAVTTLNDVVETVKRKSLGTT